jgi:hypothetical protein
VITRSGASASSFSTSASLAERARRLRAQLAGVDVRAFQVRAEHARFAFAARRRRADAFEREVDIFRRRGHGGGQHAGGAVLGVDRGDGVDGVAAFHHVLAAAAVHVQVDKAGQDIDVFVERGIGAAAVMAAMRSSNVISPWTQPAGVRILPLIASLICATPLRIHNNHSGNTSGSVPPQRRCRDN